MPSLPCSRLQCRVFSQFFRHFSKSRLPVVIADPFNPNVNEVIDVRSPDEYKEDHIPGAINLPVLSNIERHEVGKLYSEDSFKGRIYGAQLVTKNISQIIHDHVTEKPKEYSPLIYCWRGGQRSQSVAIVMAQIGFNVFVLEKGYKTYKAKVKECLEKLPTQFTFKVLSGKPYSRPILSSYLRIVFFSFTSEFEIIRKPRHSYKCQK